MFEAKTDDFSGPMEKLLELIEERHIEISRVNLAAVTADFIAYVERLGTTVSPVVVSDFVVVAARLLVLKSKILLPTLELTNDEEAEIMDLEQRLKLYREFKAAAVLLKERWGGSQRLYTRPLLTSLGEQSFFYPSAQVTPDGLHASLERLLQVVSGLVLETRTVARGMVTLQEKITELAARLKSATTVTFKGRATKEQKEEVIVLFLAVLHMLANRMITVSQDDMFGDIVVEHQEEGSENETFAAGKLVY